MARLAAVRHRFDNRVRDLLSQLNAASGPAPGKAVLEVVRQGLTLLELGHSVLELRALIAGAGRSEARHALQDCVAALAAYFKTPTRERCATAAGAVLRAGAAVRAALPEAAPKRIARLRTALADLHSIYTCLLDQLPHAGAHASMDTSAGARHAS
jgi:ribosomal protein S12 methylthiotransferase accessory factor YcaO